MSYLIEGRFISSFFQLKTPINQVRPQVCDGASVNLHTHILLDSYVHLVGFIIGIITMQVT